MTVAEHNALHRQQVGDLQRGEAQMRAYYRDVTTVKEMQALIEQGRTTTAMLAAAQRQAMTVQQARDEWERSRDPLAAVTPRKKG